MPVDIATVTGVIVIGIILIGVVGNVPTLFVFFRYDPLRDVTGLFLANLAVADLLQAIFGMPLIATSAFREEWVFGDTLCIISGMTNSLFCITSVLTLTAVSVDRYLAIVHPFQYPMWLTIKRARVVVVCLWLLALLAALLPVFGWSRYVYLPYEFVCTVQWEYDKAYTIFVWCICFVAPLFVTVACYSRIMKVARHQAREKPPTTVGRLSEPEQVPDVGETAVDDGNNQKSAKENLAFIADGLNNSEKIASTKNEKTNVVCISRDVIDQSRDPDPRGYVSGNPETSVSLSPSGMLGMFGRNLVVVPEIPNTSSGIEPDEASRKDCASSSVSRLGTSESFRAEDSTVIVVHSGNPKNSTQARKDGASHKHSTKTSVGPSGKLWMSRVSPTVAPSPELNSWTKENPQRDELTVIPEEEEDAKIKHPRRSYLTRVRARMTEWKIGDRQHRRKEMKVALILLVVNGTFVLCWLPHFIGALCLTFSGGLCPLPDSFFIVTTTLAMLNSGCNPFIYTLTFRKFRKAFKRVLPCFRSNRTHTLSE